MNLWKYLSHITYTFILHVLKSSSFVKTLKYNRNIPSFPGENAPTPTASPVNCCLRCPFTLYLTTSPPVFNSHLMLIQPHWFTEKSDYRIPPQSQQQIYSFSLHSYLYKGTNYPIKSILICTRLYLLLTFQGLHFLSDVSSLLILQIFYLFIISLFHSTGLIPSIYRYSLLQYFHF